MKNITLNKDGECITIHTPAGRVLVRCRGPLQTRVSVSKNTGGTLQGHDWFIETETDVTLPPAETIPVVVHPHHPSVFDFAETTKTVEIRHIDTVTMQEIGKEGTALWHKVVKYQKQKR